MEFYLFIQRNWIGSKQYGYNWSMRERLGIFRKEVSKIIWGGANPKCLGSVLFCCKMLVGLSHINLDDSAWLISTEKLLMKLDKFCSLPFFIAFRFRDLTDSLNWVVKKKQSYLLVFSNWGVIKRMTGKIKWSFSFQICPILEHIYSIDYYLPMHSISNEEG